MNPVTIIFALMAIALMVPVGIHVLNDQSRQTMATVAALQMARIQKAAEGYITANAAAIEGTATSTNPATITIPMLVNTGYLPNGFQANNPYGQTWEVQVLQPSPGQLQALVLSTGGTTVSTRSLGLAAQIAGAAGGVVGGGSGTSAVPGCGAGQACGVYSGWKVPTSGFNAQPGHLAALIEYSNGQIQNDYLYRVSVPGQPQLNQMQTNLDMGNNNINNAQNVNVNDDVTLGNPGSAQGGNPAGLQGQLGVDEPAGQGFPGGWGGGIHTWDIYANGTFGAGENGSLNAYMNDFDGGIGGGGEVVTNSPNGANYAYMQSNNNGSSVVANGTVQGGYVNSTGNVNAQNALTAGGGGYITDSGYGAVANTFTANVLGANYIYSNGNINASGQVQAKYDVTLGTANGSASLGGQCGPNGSIAANSNGSGQILSCVNGQWSVAFAPAYNLQSFSFGNGFCNAVNCPYFPYYIGYHHYCALSAYGQYGNAYVSVFPSAGPNAQGQYLWQVQSQSGNVNGFTVTCY
ncbi:shufflon system plasmid conjugative transfer pilus tip adhesin PilV [Acidithiobacillus caldus]|uniref:shufflon system plasmid conjugative transfer pilus tip adhesin PilV n=1 Tax=Acidithiobacillus caldus TaxID=33059 RepID=UPI001C068C01|nr:shufflon system plasmid conjugative transfer pilus tip adhesin PilV [Acidithiobacillus caldus]MBU2763768.1 shufflon system plasmid conjugative transfer pilus tip adhesin PilV [Acidithiobacillus caldus]MBU2772086.1 shufflon system plasmid conjugative transfer pilus tip adhesin PilV [Acidithiobacillus caldus]MBU2782341.1 shufflon system plasmid conjugative transfer pilus tip adhesin PilV [Acidithiobacillus caldus]